MFRALDQTEFLATMHYLPAFLAAHPAVNTPPTTTFPRAETIDIELISVTVRTG